jgi:phosphohistidine phosphatase SixA
VIVLLRHASAGSRRDWQGDDRLRPLDDKGFHQAWLLVEPLAALGVSAIVSSPYVRCTQTVEPLAQELGLVVEESDALAEGASRAAALELAESAGPGAVLCTHGDVIEAVLEAGLKKAAAALIELTSPHGVQLVGSVSAPS